MEVMSKRIKDFSSQKIWQNISARTLHIWRLW